MPNRVGRLSHGLTQILVYSSREVRSLRRKRSARLVRSQSFHWWALAKTPEPSLHSFLFAFNAKLGLFSNLSSSWPARDFTQIMAISPRAGICTYATMLIRG